MSECISCGYTNQIEELEKEIASLKAQLKREMATVDFYASFWNWDNGDYFDTDICVTDDCSEEDIEYSDGRIYKENFGGKLARETVKARSS